MQRKNYFLLIVAVLFSSSVSTQIHAQSETTRKVEVGAQITALHLREVGEGPLGFGGRFSYNFTYHFAFDGEATHFPQDPDGNFGQTQAVAGVKAGIRNENLLFVSIRK
jgi:hypothetical protein